MSQASEFLAAAQRFHMAGQLQPALEAAQRALALDPRNVEALALMAAVHAELGQFEIAMHEIEKALAINDKHGPTHDCLGIILANRGRLPEAIQHFEIAIKSSPGSVLPLFNMATARFQRGELDAAIEALNKVLKIDPNSRRAHAALALALARHDRLADAVPNLRELLKHSPQDPKSHFELAGALMAAGRLAEAEASYRSALEIDPDVPECCSGLASLLLRRNQYEEAAELCEQANALRPDFFDAQFGLGMARLKVEKYAQACEALSIAARLKPDSAETQVNLGISLANLMRYDEALQCFRRAIELKGVEAQALHNLGLALVQLKRLDEALAAIDRSLEIEPENPEGHYNRSTVLFFMGDLREAFREYEWRFQTRQAAPLQLHWPLWDGSPLGGKTIVLCGEQGFGDAFQFLRFAKVLQGQGARVIVQTMEKLHPLASRTAGVDGCIGPQAKVQADFCIPMMSVPNRLGTSLETLPADVPYLFADPALVDTWRERLASIAGLRVGIVWQGNPSIGGDRNRSIQLSNYAPLTQAPGVRLISLQKGPGVDQLAAVRDAWNIVDLGDQIDGASGAFSDTAAVMKNLDLIISSDTSAAHLAGGLGVPVWLALEYIPDWRWLLEREDSPWYPTMRVFRQSQRGDWRPVFAQMASALPQLGNQAGR